MSLGPGTYGQTSHKMNNSSKKIVSSSIQATKVFDLPDFDASVPSEPGNLSYDNGIVRYFNGSGWIPLGGGVILNAPDTNPLPNPNFLVNGSSEVRNIKTQGNGITLVTSSNSLVLNYQPTITSLPSSTPYTPWENGRYTRLYSSTLAIAMDPNGNYSIESSGSPGGFFPENADDTDLIPNKVELVELSGNKIRLVVPKEGMSVVQADPSSNYVSFMGYDTKAVAQTVGTVTNSFPFSLPTGEAYFYKFFIKGVNLTDGKLYIFELNRAVKNFGGTPITQNPVNIIETDGDLVQTPTFSTGVNLFTITVHGLSGKTINWSIYSRRI